MKAQNILALSCLVGLLGVSGCTSNSYWDFDRQDPYERKEHRYEQECRHSIHYEECMRQMRGQDKPGNRDGFG